MLVVSMTSAKLQCSVKKMIKNTKDLKDFTLQINIIEQYLVQKI